MGITLSLLSLLLTIVTLLLMLSDQPIVATGTVVGLIFTAMAKLAHAVQEDS